MQCTCTCISFCYIAEKPKEEDIKPVDPVFPDMTGKKAEDIPGVSLDWSKTKGTKIETDLVSMSFFDDTKPVDSPDDKMFKLTGGKYASLASKAANSCLLDLENCGDGLTVTLDVKFETIAEDTYILSSGAEAEGSAGIAVFYRFGKFWSIVSTKTKTWTLELQTKVEFDTWLKFEVSFHNQTGLAVYINDNEVGRMVQYVEVKAALVPGTELFLGRSYKVVGSFSSQSVFSVQKFDLYYGFRELLLETKKISEGMHLFLYLYLQFVSCLVCKCNIFFDIIVEKAISFQI